MIAVGSEWAHVGHSNMSLWYQHDVCRGAILSPQLCYGWTDRPQRIQYKGPASIHFRHLYYWLVSHESDRTTYSWSWESGGVGVIIQTLIQRIPGSISGQI